MDEIDRRNREFDAWVLKMSKKPEYRYLGITAKSLRENRKREDEFIKQFLKKIDLLLTAKNG